ncbi:MAG: serine/threonine-protein kinase [Planctomycetota bacterium]
MDPEQLKRLEQLFHAAVDLSAEGRAAFLEAEVEPELRPRIEAMLDDLSSGGSLAPAALAAGDPGVGGAAEGPGMEIGRYKLLQEIGEGGFGVVYMAEQLEPVVRRVALKVIKLGMDTREVVARFEAERQALALMDHPNIARVLDGGATAEGRPYFVMELVRGVSITEYCDRNSLATRERLELFVEVCNAVQHAHQKGVLHRDLKPSNVMVTLHDGRPVSKVIDFGVAKAMHTRLTEKTLFTAYERFIGTPAYMSPEQAELSGLDIDTRSDVYSLGVLLYELLTGSTPFDPRMLIEEGLGEIQRVIREETPQRPSVRISTTADATIAARRRSDVPALSRVVRGDLDWIVMKCLEKDRRRRFDSASELASDVRRHLEGQPVLAGPPSAVYRARKFLSRNRAAAASIAVIGTVLVGGIIGTSLGMIEAGRQRDDAIESTERANVVTEFLVETLALADPEFALNPDVSVQELLLSAAQRVDAAFADQPRSEARIRGVIGRAFRTIGEVEAAERHLRRAAQIAGELGDYDALDHYNILWSLTHVLFYLERHDGLAMAQRAREVAHGYIRSREPELADELDRFIALTGELAWGAGSEPAGVLASFERTRELAHARVARGDQLWLVLADSWVAAGFSLWYTPKEAISEPFWHEALEVFRRELPPNHPQIAETASQLVGVLNRQGKSGDAVEVMEGTVEGLREVLRPDNFHLAYAESMLGDVLVQVGRFEEAERLLLAAHEIIRESTVDDSHFYYVDSLCRLIGLYAAWERDEAARPLRDELAMLGSRAHIMHAWIFAMLCFQPEQAELRDALAAVDQACGSYSYTARGTVPPAEDFGQTLAAALAALDGTLAMDDPRSVVVARLMLGWSKALVAEDAGEERTQMVSFSLEHLLPYAKELPLDLADAHAQLSELAALAGEARRAERQARLASEALRAREGRSNWLTAQVQVRIARTLLRQGMYRDAEELLVPSQRILADQIGSDNTDTKSANALLVDLYEAWGKPERAEPYRE